MKPSKGLITDLNHIHSLTHTAIPGKDVLGTGDGGAAVYRSNPKPFFYFFIFLTQRYLAKTCWGPQIEGLLYLEVTFVTPECVLRNCSIKGQGVDYRNRDLPEIMFYASYDNSFSLANMAAATRDANSSSTDAVDAAKTNCQGSGAIFRETMFCNNLNAEGVGSQCTMKKTYNVMNRGSETSLVYLVASKCGLVGLIHWGIKVSLRPGSGISQLTDLDLPPAVCGARGSGPQRCYADNGGSCAIQEPWVLANHRDWEKNGKIDRAHIAIGAIVFCIVIAVGIVAIKYYQARHKRQRLQRQYPMMGRGPSMPPAVSGGTELPVEEGGLSFQTNGDSLPSHHLA